MPLTPSWKGHRVSGSVIRVLVLGGGVTGLTTALELLERGYDVTILAKEFPTPHGSPKFASEASGAIYAAPNMMRAKEGNESILPKLKAWSEASGRKFFALCGNPSLTGVHLRELVSPLKQKATTDDLKMHKALPGFYHSSSLLEEKGICTKTYKDAYSYFTPSINPRKIMMWLYDECKRKGAHLFQESLRGLIRDQADTLKNRFGVRFIVNCTGLGARELAGDENVYPLRGSLLLVKNDGSLFPKISHCAEGPYTSFGIDDCGLDTSGHALVILRGEEEVALGSFYQPNRWDKDIPVSYPLVRGILKEASLIYAPFATLKDADIKVTVGFRPGRRGDVRLESDPDLPCLIHNYGHGRYGMTLSFGCAKNVVDIVDKNVASRAKL